ncbi:MAG: GAF domain-containing protein [Chloroflexi bacterium]|nr:GAF domain-containing protein [Chloroflexota bacterium]
MAASYADNGILTGEGAGPTDDVRDLLLRISRAMANARNVDEILQTMATAALHIAPSAERCVIHLLDAERNLLVPQVCSPPRERGAIGDGIPASVGIVGRALREQNTVCVDDTSRSPDFAALNENRDVQSLLVAPLLAAEQSLGTLSLSSPRSCAFGPVETQHIRTLAAQAAVVIRQAQLLQATTAQRQLSDAIIESLADGLVILDAEGRVQRYNPAMQGLMERCASPATASDERLDPLATLAWLLDAGGEVVGPYEMVIPSATGKSLTLSVTPASLSEPGDGEVRIFRDVTAERQSRRELYAFISQVSHELRTPLQHIQSYAGLLTEIEELSADQRTEFLSVVQGEADRLGLLVEDLLQFARYEQGRFEVKKRRLELSRLIANLIDKYRPRAAAAMITLESHIQPGIVALTDPLRYEQVLANILNNALRYVQAGGTVNLTLRVENGAATATIADDGPGMNPETLAHLFEPFYQGNEGKASGGGSGLGLSIGRHIMDVLGGGIRVASRPGAGSTFTVTLPAL